MPASPQQRLCLERDGAEHLPAALNAAGLAAIERLFALPADRPGARLRLEEEDAAALGKADAVAARFLGPGARPVRALLLDKGPGRNWALGWHQDRVIALRERRAVPGFERWTVKAGIVHAEPPFAIVERMLTLRLHLDDAGPGNAPLLVAPGSHRLGRIAERDIEPAVRRLGSRECHARAGDIWAYAAPILHASRRAERPGRRRVLQLSYSADELPGGLEWLGPDRNVTPPVSPREAHRPACCRHRPARAGRAWCR